MQLRTSLTLLLEIENGDTRESYGGNMVDDSLAAVRQAHSANAYNPLRRETELRDPDDNDAIEHLEQQARVLLDTLLSQREVTHDQGPDLLRGNPDHPSSWVRNWRLLCRRLVLRYQCRSWTERGRKDDAR